MTRLERALKIAGLSLIFAEAKKKRASCFQKQQAIFDPLQHDMMPFDA